MRYTFKICHLLFPYPGRAERRWVLSSHPPIPDRVSREGGFEGFLSFARRWCKEHGGGIIICMAEDKIFAAYEWRDAGEIDAEAAGRIVEFPIDVSQDKILL